MTSSQYHRNKRPIQTIAETANIDYQPIIGASLNRTSREDRQYEKFQSVVAGCTEL